MHGGDRVFLAGHRDDTGGALLVQVGDQVVEALLHLQLADALGDRLAWC